jgi:hypothetical protein
MLIAFCENCCDEPVVIAGRCRRNKSRRDCKSMEKFGCCGCVDFERITEKEELIEIICGLKDGGQDGHGKD